MCGWGQLGECHSIRTRRVLGLFIRHCAASPNNCVPGRPKLSVIRVTVKTFFERLYLVLGLSPFEPRVNNPCAPTPPPLLLRLFLDFCAIFSSSGPSIFLVSTIRQVIWPSPGPWTLVGAIVVTAKTFFERLYLVPGLGKFGP